MLGWFKSNKIDHPLADAKESRRIVADLPRDTFKAMGEIAFWLESINTTPGFRLDRRFALAEELDAAARVHLRKAANDYLHVRQQKFQENRLWSALTGFWRLIGEAYGLCIEGYQADAAGASAITAHLPAIVCRALHARGVRELVIAPVGFLSDHMEVLYDLDTEAADLCRELGVRMVRAGTVGSHPQFVRAIRQMLREAPRNCSPDCCPPPVRRPQAPSR